MIKPRKALLFSLMILSLLSAVFSIGFRMSAEASPGLITMSLTIGGTQTLDVDTGQVGSSSPDTDLWWSQVTSTERFLVPENGAELANLGIVDFDSVVDCSIYTLSKDPINGSVDNNTIPDGTVLVIKTNIANYAKMRIDIYGYDLNVTIVYQDDGSPIVGEQTYYIKADGSVQPFTSLISTADNITYTFTGNLYGSIVVEKDNIVVDGAGYMLQRNGTGRGIELTDRNNVTIKNMEIEHFQSGIWIQNSSDIDVFRNKIVNNTFGIWIFCSNNTVYGNTITNNSDSGLVIDIYSSNNIVYGNNITYNNRGTWLIMASDNILYHNNFVDNTQQVYVSASGYANIWDDDVEGNYWSDYAGSDLDSGGNGIGDDPYVVDLNNTDRFPLMGPISFFNAGTWDEVTYYAHTITNSTVSDFYFSQNDGLISFNVTGLDSSVGFCRVGIPKDLLYSPDPGDWVVRVNGTVVPFRVQEFETYSFIYFTYSHSTQNVQIFGIEVIPEFPTWALTLLIFMMLTFAIAIHKRRLLKTSIH